MSFADGKAKIFCIGFHKTGTTSLGVALEQLGFRVQGSVGTGDPDIAEKVFDLALPLLQDHDAFRDNPWPIIYKELDARWPGSKFILTVRTSESWIRSQQKHFGTRTSPMRQWIYGAGCPVGNEEDYISRFEAHNREVIAYFKDRPDDLLILDLEKGDSWEKLCAFLDKAPPDTAFPHVNPASKRAGKKKTARRGIPILSGLRQSNPGTKRSKSQAPTSEGRAHNIPLPWAGGRPVLSMKRIHITGVPSSGTTLMMNLMLTCFNIDVFPRQEASMLYLPLNRRADSILCTKSHGEHSLMARTLKHDPNQWIIATVRDPRDIAISPDQTADGLHWPHLRFWNQYWSYLREITDHPRVIVVRFEDLVANPEIVQAEINQRIDFVEARICFSEYDLNAVPSDQSVSPVHGVRPISDETIGGWRNHKGRLLRQLKLHGLIDEALQVLGYEDDGRWQEALAGIEPDLVSSSSSDFPSDAEVQSWREEEEANFRHYRWRRRIRRFKDLCGLRDDTLDDGIPTGQAKVRARSGSNFRLQRISENDAVIEFGSLGSGPLVILHPAKGRSGIDQFDELGPALGDAGFHAVAINPRGVGSSSGNLHNLSLHHLAADVAAAIRHFGGPAHLVGCALGNRVVRCCAADYPDLIKSVTLIAAGGRFPGKAPNAYQKSLFRRSRLYWTEAGRIQETAAREAPLPEWWDGGRGPMLVIQGLEDYVAVPENGRSLALDFPDRVRLLEIPDAGHQALSQRPDLIIPEVVSFITKIENDSAQSANK